MVFLLPSLKQRHPRISNRQETAQIEHLVIGPQKQEHLTDEQLQSQGNRQHQIDSQGLK
jgi:hypothetical protein